MGATFLEFAANDLYTACVHILNENRPLGERILFRPIGNVDQRAMLSNRGTGAPGLLFGHGHRARILRYWGLNRVVASAQQRLR